MAKYESVVNEISKYIEIGGMFELREGMKYTSFQNINKNSFDFKQYEKVL
jgi:hypothetical protein